MLLIRGAMLPDFETGTTTQADVLIRDGRFAAIAPHLEADCPIVEASGLLLLPGMADLHTHMVQSLTQGPLDDLNITQWLTRMLRAQWSLTEDEWYYGVLLGCLRSIRYGVTAINEMTYYPHIDAVVQAYQDAGLRVTISTDNMTLAAVTLEEGTEQVLRLVAQGIRLKDAAREVSAHTGLSKNELYAAALERS